MIAPISAMPIEPPTWRHALSTAEPTPAFSTGTARVAAAALGVIVIDIPTPPRTSAGQERPERRVLVELAEVEELAREEQHPGRHQASASRTGRRPSPRSAPR